MEFNSLKDQLFNNILPLVTKPGRYVGNEFNSIHKDFSKVSLKIALAFPDVYELGMSHLGLRIFYELINNHPDYLAERVFSPWPDMEEIMRVEKISLFSLESFHAIRDFDILAFSLQHELSYSTTINMLDLAGIPIYSKQRSEKDPLVIAGGHSAFNPEPMADFIDLFAIGDGENVIMEVMEMVAQLKKQGQSRNQILEQLATLSGIYIPSFYKEEYQENGTLRSLQKIHQEISAPIERRVEDLETAYYPTKQIVPFLEITHDRVVLEIQRGCLRGCRFCQAGYITRPRRERTIPTLIKQAQESIQNTGSSEITLLSLSSSDYSGIKELVTRLVNQYEKSHVSISLPSLRLDSSSIDLAELTQRIKKTSFTFAVEAGSDRLRKVINKNVTEEDLEKVVTQVFAKGWLNAKFYFMIGLPTETDEDLEAMANLINKTALWAKKAAQRSCQITASISIYVPKPHTTFERMAQIDIPEANRRIYFVKDRIKHKNVQLKWHNPEQSFLEGIFSRGDRRLSQIIYRAWEKGAKLDNWSDQFEISHWMEPFQEANMDYQFYVTRKRELDEILPWSHINSGVSPDFLSKEFSKGLLEESTLDCSTEKSCSLCGLIDCPHQSPKDKYSLPQEMISDYQDTGPKIIAPFQSEAIYKLRIRFAKTEEARFTSHLDLNRTFIYAIRRAHFPIRYSQGFNPQMKFHFALPLSLGHTSEAEYAEFQLTESIHPEEFKERLGKALPPGITILSCWEIPNQSPGFDKLIQFVSYQVKHLETIMPLATLQENTAAILAMIELWVERESKQGGIKRVNLSPYIHSLTWITLPEVLLEMVLKITPNGTAKPEEILKCITGKNGKEIKCLPIHRSTAYTVNTKSMVSIEVDFAQNETRLTGLNEPKFITIEGL